MVKPKLDAYLRTYADYHRHPLNRLTHYVGIPLIVFNAVALLDWVLLGTVAGIELTLAHVLYVAVIGWYLTLDKRLAAIAAVWYALCIPLGWIAPWSVIIGAGAFGWAIQFFGHFYWEKRSPALLTNLIQALIGPIYFAAILFGIWSPPRPEPGK